MNPWAAVAAGAVVSGYAALSRRLSTTAVSGPMLFVACGIAIGPLGLDLITRSQDAELTRTLLESALTLVLFTDAAAIRTGDLRRERFLPVRLLTVGLPLAMVLGWLTAWLVLPGLGGWELALAAIILAPTDAALGEQAIADRRVPALVRHGLSVESGLNDGLALPFFVLALAAAAGGHGGHRGPLATFLLALVVSAAIGLAAGWLGARLLRGSAARGWSTPDWRQVLVLAVPVVAYAACDLVDGSGFIGAWTAGLAFGAGVRAAALSAGSPGTADADTGHTTEFTHRFGALLTALSFLFFGALVLSPALTHLNWRMVLYAVLSLTAIRMLPVAVALAGTRLRAPTVAYVGWFGPRGLASVVFGLLALEEQLPGGELLGGVVAVTVGLSVCAHGASAAYLGARYGAWSAGSPPRGAAGDGVA
ncbi:cation:proton antiporter [Streptomyces sp. NPDC053427]|uniref:cation:proton antiporter n=1 Tax=Streptomyces sp. NPDC053427 TaxID=3365701 RepID=UPI0037D6C1E3